jgi:DNA-directed RNA polymerase subunit RPC12/RpoP
MPEASTFNCPKCGASLTATGDQAEMQCPYCGNTVIVPEELRTAQPQVTQFQIPQIVVDYTPVMSQAVKTTGMFAFGLPLIIIGSTLCIILVTFLIVGQAISSAFAPFTNAFSPAKVPAVAFSTVAPFSTRVPALAPTETSFPTPLPPPTPTPYTKVVLKDDFTKTDSGWDHTQTTDITADYVKGGYRVFLATGTLGHFVWVKDGFGNVSVEADARRIGGPTDGWYGVTCRMKDGVGGYAFEVTADGGFEIDKYTFTPSGDQKDPLTMGTLDPNPLKTGAANHIMGNCDGITLSLFVNGQLADQAKDSAFKTGGVGFISLPGDSGQKGFDMLFSNFVVKGP